jgi:ribosomal protein S18 acetylase RimI-like enzyme
MVEIKRAVNVTDFENGRGLFEQYAQVLDFDLTFQQFDKELTRMAIDYNSPDGALLLAYDGDRPVACAGIRKLDVYTAELKRMFVRPEYRKQQLGQQLLQMAIDAAKQLGYRAIRLDTVPAMQAAIKLYRSFGFQEIEPYRFNPVEGAMYMEKQL